MTKKLMMEKFWKFRDFEYYRAEEIAHDNIVSGFPVKVYGSPDFGWNSGYLLDATDELWGKTSMLDVFFSKTLGIYQALRRQKITGIKSVLTASGQTYDYEVGDIYVECLVEYHTEKTYYSVLNVNGVHAHNSVGNIVALRLLNLSY
jgi:hypothetical protein